MKFQGDKWKIYIPEHLGFGSDGAPGKVPIYDATKVPAYSALIFDVTMNEILGPVSEVGTFSKVYGKSIEETRALFIEALASDSPRKEFPLSNEDL
jgi:hypothetical protein